MRRKGIATGLFLFLMIAGAFPAAAIVLEMSLPELASGADDIIEGTVVGKTCLWNADRTHIFTTVEIAVGDRLKGAAGKKTALLVPGGRIGEEWEWVSDTPGFEVGEKVILFLRRLSRERVAAEKLGTQTFSRLPFDLVGCFQGKFTVEGQEVNGHPAAWFKDQIRLAMQGLPVSIEPTENVLPPVGASPKITSISPTSASAGTGTPITISGSGFGSTSGQVQFFYRSGQPTIPGWIASWTDTQVKINVPTGYVNLYPASASSGPVFVRTAGGTNSNNAQFTVTFSYGGSKWTGTCPEISYKINNNGKSDWGNSVMAAANTWTLAGANFRLLYGGTTTATKTAKNGVNEVLWMDLAKNEVLGEAHIYGTGTITECDFVFNKKKSWSSANFCLAGKYDIWSIAVHEMGHWLFLRDLYGNKIGYPKDTAKVMYGFASDGATKRTLNPTDKDGIKYIYGDAAATTKYTITSPKKNESWKRGTIRTIKWTYTGNPGVGAALSLYKNGVFKMYIGVVPTVSGGNGSFNWYIPTWLEIDETYQILIQSFAPYYPFDYSDGTFVIY